MLKIAFMASGTGSNFQVILDRIRDGRLSGVKVEFLITNNSKCGAAELARAAGIPVYHISGNTHPDPKALAKAMVDIVDQHGVELMVLAGYMKQVPDALLARLPDRVINVHPALLPAFGGPGHWGRYVHEAVVAAGVRVTGATVHFVDSVYDHGMIIAQRAVSIPFEATVDEVAALVLQQEHDLFWRVVEAFAQGKVQVVEGRVECSVS